MKSLPEAILEGLIHNLRTPLNLMLGYAQKMDKEKNIDYAKRIHQAGLKMDDQMQNTWEAWQFRMRGEGNTELNEWLKQELALLSNHLQMKHRVRFEAVFDPNPQVCELAPSTLSERFETFTLALVQLIPDGLIDVQLTVGEAVGLCVCVSDSHNACLKLAEEPFVLQFGAPAQIVSLDSHLNLRIDVKLL